MEVLNKLKNLPLWLSLGFIVLSIGVISSFFNSVSDQMTDTSVKESTEKVIDSVEVSPSSILMAETKPQVKKKKISSKVENPLPDEEKFYSKFDVAQNELASKLVTLEEEHKNVLNNYRKNKIYINSKLRFGPRLLIVLSFYLDKEIKEISNRDLKELDLKSSDWYLLKTFSESKDFEILLQRKSLNPNHVRLEELKDKYKPLHS